MHGFSLGKVFGIGMNPHFSIILEAQIFQRTLFYRHRSCAAYIYYPNRIHTCTPT